MQHGVLKMLYLDQILDKVQLEFHYVLTTKSMPVAA
jgi:hypothetical protein